MSDRPARIARFLLGSLIYLGLSAIWIYGVVDQGRLEGSDIKLWTVLGLVAVAHIAFGFGIREWPGLLLPIAVLPFAILAGYPESQFSEPLPVWFGQLVMVQLEIPLIAAGLGLGSLANSRRAAPRSS